MEVSVHILMATYNGEQFLRAQLNSIFSQSFQNFLLMVRDDGSTDSTIEILQEYQRRYPEKIKIISDDLKNLGVTHNFSALLGLSNAEYIFFSDQDDIWLDNKLETELKKMKSIEEANVPCLVYSDMRLIDEEGNGIAESAWKQMNLHPRFFTLNRLLVQNIPHGCSMAINKAMRNLAYPIPQDVLLHDHWIALLAASCGKSAPIVEPTMQLRNHTQNITRRQTSVADKLKRFSENFFSGEMYEYFIHIRVRQARALQERCASCMSDAKKITLANFIRLENTKGLSRKKIFLQNKFFRTTFLHTLKMVLRA